MWQLTPVERVYLCFIALILGSMIWNQKWDPVAGGIIALFVGLIPAGRKDRQKAAERKHQQDSADQIPVIDSTVAEEMRDVLRKYLKRQGDSE
jgi:hypothetical protein